MYQTCTYQKKLVFVVNYTNNKKFASILLNIYNRLVDAALLYSCVLKLIKSLGTI